MRAYQREWVEKNHDKKLAYQKGYRDRKKRTDPSHSAAYQRDYRARNRDKINAQERARRAKRVPTPQRRATWRAYKRSHPMTEEQKAKRLVAQRAWYAANRDVLVRKRRERYGRRVRVEVYIPESTSRMEVEAEMWIAQAEGRDPEQARRDWFRREKGWAASTVLIRSPHSDGPLYDKEKVA